MLTYIGFRKVKATLSGDSIVVAGSPRIIENLKEIEDYKSQTTLSVALSIQTIIVLSLMSIVVNFANYRRSDQMFVDILFLAMIAASIAAIRFATKYRAAWIYNDNMTLLIEKADPASLLSNLHEIAQVIARRPGMKSVQCPYCLLRTPPIKPGVRSCSQCDTKFTIEGDYSLINIKRPRFYSSLAIASFLILLIGAVLDNMTNILDKLPISFGKGDVLIPVIILFSSFIGAGLHHGILPARSSTIYRVKNPKLFNVLLLLYAGFVLFMLWLYLTMH